MCIQRWWLDKADGGDSHASHYLPQLAQNPLLHNWSHAPACNFKDSEEDVRLVVVVYIMTCSDDVSIALAVKIVKMTTEDSVMQ